MVNKVNLDKELEEISVVQVFQPEDMPEYPRTCDVPDGWSAIAAMDGGDCWYQRALFWEKRFGKKLLPLEYTYNEEGNIVKAETLDESKALIEEGESNGASDTNN